MHARATGGKLLILCLILAFGASGVAQASSHSDSHHSATISSAHGRHGDTATPLPRRHTRGYRVVPISCVPFARRDSGIEVAGNAWEWWENAAGLYARGSVPQVGSVLAFQTNRHMRLGHVAVVSRVLNRREIEVDQANWPNGRGISRGVPVVDVSERNDWTAVRVGLGHSGNYGSIYPTYGFIYDRRDTGTLIASARMPSPRPELNPAPADLRDFDQDEQVAELPAPRHAARPAAWHRHAAAKIGHAAGPSGRRN
jgi:surface antigen